MFRLPRLLALLGAVGCLPVPIVDDAPAEWLEPSVIPDAPVDPDDPMARMIWMMQYDNRFVVSTKDLPSSWPTDPARVHQILVNLLSNAAKFTRHGTVRLHAGTEDEFLKFRVQDTGVGMTEEQLTRIFDVFEQASPETSRTHGGTGLGLAISKRSAELIQSTLHVTSRPGLGTTFTLSIPKYDASLATT